MYTTQDAYHLGFSERLASLPGEFSSGRTWDTGADAQALNEAYDRGANAAEAHYRKMTQRPPSVTFDLATFRHTGPGT